MRRNRIAIALLVLGLLGLVVYWFGARADQASSKGPEAAAPQQTLDGRKRARQQMEVDLTPAALGGRVIRADDGNPIAGARVSIAEHALDFGALSQPGESAKLLSATTDTAGRWQLAPVPSGRYTVTAAARAYIPDKLADLVIHPGEHRTDLELALVAGGNLLTGTVSDIGGGPVPGALIRATPIGKDHLLTTLWTGYSTMTNDGGHYELTLGDGAYALTLHHPDYMPEADMVELRDGPATQDFTVVPGAVIHGQVITREEGQPVPGALVSSSGGLGRGADQLIVSGIGWGGVATDNHGQFVLRGVGAGAIQLRASGRGYASQEPTEVQVGIGEQVDGVIIEVGHAHSISGFVVKQGRHDEPVAGAMVGAWSFSPPAMLAAISPTADDGYFEIHGVPSGRYMVAAAREQLVPNLMSVNVTVKNEDLTEVIVELDPGVTLRGRLVPATVASLHIEIDPETISILNLARTAGQALASARSDAEGVFELAAVQPGKLTLVASGDDGSEGRLTVEVADRDQDGLTIEMAARPSVSGRVVDERGAPVANAHVSVSPQQRPSTFVADVAGLIDQARGAPTDPEGRFQAIGLTPGPHELTVSDGRGQLQWAGQAAEQDPYAPRELEVTAGQNITGLQLVVESRGGVIRGTVVGPDGAPVTDAWVVARKTEVKRQRHSKPTPTDGDSTETKKSVSVSVSVGSEGSEVDSKQEQRDPKSDHDRSVYSRKEKPVLTDADGHFEIRNLRDGTYNIRADGLRGSARGEADKVPVDTEVTITLERLAGLTGTVTYDGAPVTEYSIRVKGPSRARRYIANKEGRYTVLRLEPGSYDVEVVSPLGSKTATAVEVSANKTATKNLSLVPWSSVYGTVVDGTSGEPMEGLVMFAYTDGASDFSELAMDVFSGQAPRTDAGGRFRIKRLAAGEGTAVFVDGDAKGFQLVASSDFVLERGQDKDLGEIRGIPASDIPRDERGDLGLDTATASWEQRPLADGAAKDDEPPSGVASEQAEYLWISYVKAGGPAEAAGLVRGDRITAVNNMSVEQFGPRMVNQTMSPLRLRDEQQVRIDIDRDGDLKSITVTAAKQGWDEQRP